MEHNPKTLTQTFSFANGIELRNRIAMAPMTTWSANPDDRSHCLGHYRGNFGGHRCLLRSKTYGKPVPKLETGQTRWCTQDVEGIKAIPYRGQAPRGA